MDYLFLRWKNNFFSKNYFPSTEYLVIIMEALFFFFFFSLGQVAFRILVLQPGIKPVPTAVDAWGPNHWATSEFPEGTIFNSWVIWNILWFESLFVKFRIIFFYSLLFLFIYVFWLQWVFVAALGLSLVAASRGYSLLWRMDFSNCGTWAE